jgi:D-alanyl-lipoteichoic acid acyltransferase DltB (MBOAT superfamily)
LPKKTRWVLLLVASCAFYMAWRAELIVLIIFTGFVNYIASLLINRKPAAKKIFLATCLCVNFGLLIVFKYLNFFSDTILWVSQRLSIPFNPPEFSIILPMGISFYTFQAAAYTIDIYRGKLKPERNFLKLLLFITFFPQLVAGPIERAEALLNQFNSLGKIKPSISNFSTGVKYLLLGFFKKAVVADRLADCVNTVYNLPESFSGLSLVAATLFFAFQIYCDFSGYSDIAVGSAKLLGIELTQNFRRPYAAASIREFWRRWHITLSSWLRDYVYIPLGGSRVSKHRNYLNILITFLASGLWHGADWTFVLWGGLHGVFQIVESAIFGRDKKLPFILEPFILKPFASLFTFLLVCFTWIFFRANTVGDAIFILSRIISDFGDFDIWFTKDYLLNTLSSMGVTLLDVFIDFGLLLFIMFLDLAGVVKEVSNSNVIQLLRVLFYALLFVLIMSLAKFYSGGQFIYFQF